MLEVLELEEKLEVKKLRVKEGKAHTRNQISGILLFYIIVIVVIRVNICYNKV